MKTIGIKLADGSFYPVLEDNTPSEKNLELTTAHNNQTKIMVDLYRSANCSMEDAEYVDSLQIENLVAHTNGEPSIKFSISIDEDNQLSAKIIDEETGNESNTTITLVSRTLEERLVTDEYDINDSVESDNKSSVAGAAIAGAAAGGLLATAMALRNKSEEEAAAEPEEPSIEDTVIDEEEPAFEEFAIPEEEIAENTDATEIAEEDEPVVEAVDEPAAETDLPDMDMDFDIPEDDSEITSEEITEEPAETVESEIESEPETEEADVENEPAPDFSDMDFDIPDDNSDIISDDIVDDSTEETTTSEDSELPDMDFDLPDDPVTEDEQPQMPDDFFDMEDTDTSMNSTDFEDDSPAPAGLNFDGLYDEETERGTPAEDDVEEVKKKTKVPVIICIICAIICIIATLLILFIIPSKYNLLTKKNAKDAGKTVAIEQPAPEPEPIPEPEPEPEVPEAKEDEIIIIEKAEEVVPQQPPVAEEKPKNITYKIKWGDTLWDIADTYYKNPWRYKYIARYNGIRNPDYIISGTLITIPAE